MFPNVHEQTTQTFSLREIVGLYHVHEFPREHINFFIAYLILCQPLYITEQYLSVPI